jgi:hypothetical protein
MAMKYQRAEAERDLALASAMSAGIAEAQMRHDATSPVPEVASH